MRYDKLIDSLQNLIHFKPTQQALASILGIAQTAINGRAKRNSNFSDEEIQKIEQFYDVQLKESTVANIDCLEVDYYPDIYASCGMGCIVFDESKEKLTIAKSTIPYYSPNEKYFVVTCKGSSMSPVLEENDKAINQQWQGERPKD